MPQPNCTIANTAPRVVAPTLKYPTSRPTWLKSCLEVLLPTTCLVCRRPLRHSLICYRCRPQLPDLADLRARCCSRCFSPFGTTMPSDTCETCKLFPLLTDSIQFLWEYDSLARDLIRTMKYRPSIALASIGGGLLRDAIPHLCAPSHWDAIAPVPSSPTLFRKRLVHPCTELARPIARALQTPLVDALQHGTRRAPQASLSHDERLRRLRKLFSTDKRFNPEGKRILLVEDVITTGATISAAAHTLKQAGAARVDVIALARTRVWSRLRRRLYESF